MLDGVPILALTPSAIVSLVVLLVITDRLVWHKRLDVLEKRVEAQDDLIADLTRQNRLMLDSALPTVNAVFGALGEAAKNVGGSDP